MTQTFYQILLGVSGAGYAAVVLMLTRALGRVRSGDSEARPFVSVVVAARNERAAIAECLDAILVQDYPPGHYEVVVADDRSTDGTAAILDTLAGERDNLRIIHIDACPVGLSPKKHALARAIGTARGNIILQTDADCTVPTAWMTGMVRRFEAGVDMVTGVAPYRRAPGLLAGFVRHEYLWNILLGAGSIAFGAGTHASGRNLGFRRAAFLDRGGYGDAARILSGDDTLLMQRFQHASRDSVATEPAASTHVVTDPPATIGAFVRQRIRHMSTGRHFRPFHVATGVIVYGFHLIMIAGVLGAWAFPAMLWPALAAFALKCLVDGIAFHTTDRVFGLDVAWAPFVAYEALLVAYLALFPILGALVPVRWKENR